MCNCNPRRTPRRSLRPIAILLAVSAAFSFSARAAETSAVPPKSPLMPVPAQMQWASGRLAVTETFTVAATGFDDARLQAAIERVGQRWTARTGLKIAGSAKSAAPTLAIECKGAGLAIPAVDEDESYTLDVTAQQATLRAPTVVGAMRGLETLLQLLDRDANGWFLPAVSVRDQPRFPWRGLLIDVCRHWQPIEVIKRNLDGMAAVKLNVLHLHLTEDQGFRVECKKFPELQAKGSDGNFFTQDQIREIVAYAAARGIRVMPEFDIPGHATSWVVSHPEFASLAGPYEIERHWGVFDPVLDPTNEDLYKLLDGFLGEMAALFPDAYLHIGGDENNGVQWDANPLIQALIRDHDLKNNEGLHAYFNRRVSAILTKYGKKLIGWDEILHPDLPKDAVIHSWRGQKGLVEAARRGFSVILSNGYYIDLMHPASDHYLNDPLPASTPLTAEQQKRVLGGEATMWAEWVTPETIDSRIWPRTAAIAERLWSPRDVRDVPDMYRRLAIVSQRLDEAGLLHEKNREALLRCLVGEQAAPADVEAFRIFIDAVEPVKNYRRGRFQPGSVQSTPLTGLTDCARADSPSSRNFGATVEAFLFAPHAFDPAVAERLMQQLRDWEASGRRLAGGLAAKSPALKDAAPVAQALAEVSVLGQETVQVLRSGRAPGNEWVRERAAKLLRSDEPGPAAIELPMLPALKLLIAAAAEQEKYVKLSGDAWRQHLLTIAFPPKPKHESE